MTSAPRNISKIYSLNVQNPFSRTASECFTKIPILLVSSNALGDRYIQKYVLERPTHRLEVLFKIFKFPPTPLFRRTFYRTSSIISTPDFIHFVYYEFKTNNIEL